MESKMVKQASLWEILNKSFNAWITLALTEECLSSKLIQIAFKNSRITYSKLL